MKLRWFVITSTWNGESWLVDRVELGGRLADGFCRPGAMDSSKGSDSPFCLHEQKYHQCFVQAVDVPEALERMKLIHLQGKI